jgi:hypothetical protein
MERSGTRRWIFGLGKGPRVTPTQPFIQFKALFDDEYDQIFAELYSAQETDTI